MSTTNGNTPGIVTALLSEQNIPPALLSKARAWFDRQIKHLKLKHGPQWAAHRDWLASYLNEELREHLENHRG